MTSAIAQQESLTSTHLVELNLDTGVVRMNTSGTDIVYQGYTYLSDQGLLSIGQAKHTGKINTTPLSIEFPITSEFIAVVKSQTYRNRSMSITRVFLDDEGLVTGDPLILHSGFVKDASITTDAKKGTTKISFKTSNIWSKFERKPGLRTNNETQQYWYPGDRGFEYANISDNRKENWKAKDQ